MKRRLLALMLALSLLTVPARAAENSMDNFIRNEGAYSGQFSDVTETDTFYENVTALYELGLTVGKGDGTFGAAEPLTVSQVVIFAGRIRSLYRTGSAEAGPAAFAGGSGAVCLPYLAYLKAEGVIADELDGVLFTAATRAQMAHIAANTLPEEAMPPINRDIVNEGYATGLFITDVTEYTPWQQDILKLYRCGIAMGSDAVGTFRPDAPITRGAATAMLTRLADPDLRILLRPAVRDVPDVSGLTLADLVKPGRYVSAPVTDAEMDETVRYMLASGSNRLTLRFPGISTVGARHIMHQALTVVKHYCEQGYNAANCTADKNGSLQLTFYASGVEGSPEPQRTAALEAAKAVHDQLWANGTITADMSEYEKAMIYYIWICANCTYDQNATDNSLSHLPYSLFHRQTAVCDGYTGAYNLLLKLEGIDCYAQISDDGEHIWTVATLDGTKYHIDTTWGDAGDGALSLYFGMTPELSEQLHRTAAP